MFSKGYILGNLDVTIIAQKPKLAAYIPMMKSKVALILKADENQVNIKATTEEKLGFTGSGEGISTHAVCLLRNVEDER